MWKLGAGSGAVTRLPWGRGSRGRSAAWVPGPTWVSRATGVRVRHAVLSETTVAAKHPRDLHASRGTLNPKPREHLRFTFPVDQTGRPTIQTSQCKLSTWCARAVLPVAVEGVGQLQPSCPGEVNLGRPPPGCGHAPGTGLQMLPSGEA